VHRGLLLRRRCHGKTIVHGWKATTCPIPVFFAGVGHFCSKLKNLGSFHDVTSTLELPEPSYDTVWQLTPGTSFHPVTIFSKR
jgi:hypothetical protein